MEKEAVLPHGGKEREMESEGWEPSLGYDRDLAWERFQGVFEGDSS